MRGYVGEILFWLAVFVGFSLAYTGFKPLMKSATGVVPLPSGLKEAIAGS